MPPRSRNFDGCWTCRIRKVKCDNTKPTCLRCRKTGVQCRGYDISLVWAELHTVNGANEKVLVASSKGPLENRSSRRRLSLVKFPQSMQYDTYKELNDIVITVDSATAQGRDPVAVGPFGMFPTVIGGPGRAAYLPDQSDPRVSSSTAERHVPNNEHGKSRAAPAPAPKPAKKPRTHMPKQERVPDSASPQNSSNEADSAMVPRGDNSYIHHELLDAAKLAIWAIKGPRYRFTEQGMLHILYPKFFPNVESDEWEPDLRILNSYFSVSQSNEVILSPLLRSMSADLLKSTVSFTRVYDPRGPWNTLVVPVLKQMFYEMICEEYSATEGWQNHLIDRQQMDVPRDVLLRNLRLTIFCMCISLSCAERSLRRPRRNSSDGQLNQDIRYSIELRKVAINSLNYHLDEYHDNSMSASNDDYDTFLLLALILQIQLDVTFGVFENFELMYAIGDFILKKPKVSKEKQLPVERFLRNRFNILNIFYGSTQSITFFNYSIPEKDQRSKYSDLNENYDLSKTGDRNNSSEFSDADSDSDSDGGNRPVQVKESMPLTFTVNFDGSRTPKPKPHADNEAIYNQVYEIPKQELLEPTNSSSPLTISPDDKSVFVTFGIPKSLIQLFHEVVQLTNHKAVFRSKGVTPRNFPRICADTEDRLINWNVENHWKLYDNEYNPISNVATKTFISPLHEGIFYYVKCFHNALIIYYKRLISEAPLKEVQGYIEKSFSKLEKLLKLMDVSSRETFSFSPSFWPLLVCGCDIDLSTHSHLKDKCQELWSSPCYQTYNYWRSKQILFEVWHRQSEEGTENGFMDMIREWDIVMSLG